MGDEKSGSSDVEVADNDNDSVFSDPAHSGAPVPLKNVVPSADKPTEQTGQTVMQSNHLKAIGTLHFAGRLGPNQTRLTVALFTVYSQPCTPVF